MINKNMKHVAAIAAVLVIATAAWAAVSDMVRWDTVSMTELQKVANHTGLNNIISPYTKTDITDPLAHTQWGYDDCNADVVRKAFKTELDSSTTDVFVVVADWCGVDITNTDIKDRIYILSADAASGDVFGFNTTLANDPAANTDLTSKNWKDVVSGEPQTPTYVDYLHGTHIAGVIAAEHNGKEIAGIDPKAHIIVVRVGDSYSIKHMCNWIKDTLYRTLQIKTGNPKPRIILQSSLGGAAGTWATNNPRVTDAINAAKAMCEERGILFVQSAGNDRLNLFEGIKPSNGEIAFPECMGMSMDNFISVAAHDIDRNLAVFSNYSTSGNTAQVHVSAPGAYIVSTGRGYRVSDDVQIDECYVESGTSMAAPHVSGVAALLWRLFPDATAGEIKQLVEAGANISREDTVAAHHGEAGTKISNYVRYGFLDAAASVAASKTVLGAARGRDLATPVKKIAITSNKTNMNEGDTATVSIASFKPLHATNATFDVKCDPASAFTITGSGMTRTITANTPVSAPSAKVWAEARDGGGTKSSELTITLNAAVHVTSIALASSAGNTIGLGGTSTLSYTVQPSNAQYDPASTTWTTASGTNNTVSLSATTGATVTITGQNAGTERVTATVDGVTNEISITVNPAITHVDALTLDAGTKALVAGNTARLNATVMPVTAPQTVTWRSSNEAVATVDSTGNVTAVGAGTAVITATSTGAKADGSHATATCTVTVTAPAPAPAPDGGGGGGGCNAGAGSVIALLLAGIPLALRRKR